jgi:antirestriction protein ArdC
MPRKQTNADMQKAIVDRVLESLNEGTIPWRCPWMKCGGPLRENGQPYRGINVILLMMAMSKGEYDNPYFLTFRQINKLGGRVKKGEKSTEIYFFKPFVPASEKSKPAEEQKKVFMMRSYRVFNVEQAEDLPAKYAKKPELPGSEVVPTVDELVKKSGAKVEHIVGNNSAYYNFSRDKIVMPAVEQFKTSEGWAAVMLHELTHWTGHESRLDRQIKNQFGSPAYALEELTAELGSAFLCGELGVNPELPENSVAYLQNWIEVLGNNPKTLFQAASAAAKAVALVNGDGAVEAEETNEETAAPVAA